jgi:hypothetical protein
MRRLVLLGCCIILSGCDFPEWHHLPFTASPDPYLPKGNSENVLRAQGLPVNVQPLTAEPGNVWPPPPAAEPTLESLEQEGGQLPNEAVPPPVPAQRGSSTPPPLPAPPPTSIPEVPPVASPNAPAVVPPPVVNTPSGPGAVSGGGGGYRTITLPNGTTGIVVPNGNGTSTVIYSNGQVQTIPTPK